MIFNNKRLWLSVLIFSGLGASTARAEALSDVALIHKCYAHLTGLRLPLGHSLLAQVKAGTLKGEQACDALVDRVMLNSTGYAYSMDNETRLDMEAALNHLAMQNRQKIGSINFDVALPDAGQFQEGNTDIHDSNIASLIMTEALLNPNRRYSDIFKLSRIPRAERELSTGSKFIQGSARMVRNFLPAAQKTNMTSTGFLDELIFPDLQLCANKSSRATNIKNSGCTNTGTTGPDSNVVDLTQPASPLGIENNLLFPDSYAPASTRIKIGALKGIVYDPNYKLRFPSSAAKDPYFKSVDGTAMPALDLRRTIDKDYASPEGDGGGLIGTQEYLMLNFGWSYHFKADGLVAMPRRWSQNVLRDFLCRSVPVVRESDARPFVLPGSETDAAKLALIQRDAGPFRYASNCTACHSTMDRLAGVVRNVSWRFSPYTNDNNSPGSTINLYRHPLAATQVGANTPWRDYATPSGDTPFHQKPPIGRLFMRSYDGRLYDMPLDNLQDLGAKLSSLDDTYVCAVKQYMKQLTNIDVSLHDIGDPNNSSFNKSMTQDDWDARDFVIKLGLELKSHQKLSTTVKDIMKSKYFKERSVQRSVAGDSQ